MHAKSFLTFTDVRETFQVFAPSTASAVTLTEKNTLSYHSQINISCIVVV